MAHTRSMIVAVPIPAPMHNVTSAVSRSRPFQFVDRDPEDHGAVAPSGCPIAIGSAVHIDLVRVEPERLQIAQDDRREGLV